MENTIKIKEFTDLVAWREAHKLALETYICSKNFPRDEIFSLTNQMRRSAVSVASNIAEGFGRWSPRDKTHFYQQAHGSITELKSQILLSRDLNYLEEKQFRILIEQSNKAHALLQGLLKSARQKVEKTNTP